MKWIFWISVVFVAYTYAGYPLWLWLRAQFRPWPARRGSIVPTISVLMVVRNEEAALIEKLDNLLSLEYPESKCQIVVVSDGSTDGTQAILAKYQNDPRMRVVCKKISEGKALGLNDALRAANGEILILTDARQKIERCAVRLLVENFADPEVGAVSGELMLGDPVLGERGEGIGLYWKIEKKIRELESASGSVIGATGALYAIRRKLAMQVPGDTILDDVLIPMNVAKRGFRVLFDGRAKAWDVPDLGAKREFRRKVRTLTGNYQLLQLAPWLLGKQNPLRFEFISHKLMRLFVPVFLLAALLTTWFLPGVFFRIVSWMQVAFYLSSLAPYLRYDLGPLSRFCNAACTFVALNAAAVIAFSNYLTGNMRVWRHAGASGEMQA